MKKLVIAIAVTAISSMASAATYCWGVQSFDYTGPDGSGWDAGISANLYSGATAFLYLGTVTYNNGFVTDGTTYITSAGYDNTNYGYGYLDTDVNSMPTSDKITDSGSQAYSIVFVDASVSSIDDSSVQNYIILNGTSTAGYDPGTEMRYASFLDTTTVIGGSGVAWTAVPEPTSGLLLLLGVAGLALKRKRA